MTDWSRASLTETADAIAAGTTTARDVTEACLDRIARLGGTLNCFVDVDGIGGAGSGARRPRRCRRQAPTGRRSARTAARRAARAQGHVLPGRPGVGLRIEAARRLAGGPRPPPTPRGPPPRGA